MISLKEQFSKDLNIIMDERGVGDSEFCTRRILEALEKHTHKLLETQEEFLKACVSIYPELSIYASCKIHYHRHISHP